jgi:hypothetical protein
MILENKSGELYYNEYMKMANHMHVRDKRELLLKRFMDLWVSRNIKTS